MNNRLFVLPFCILANLCNVQAMDHVPEANEFVRQLGRGANTILAIQRGQLGGSYVENQYIRAGSQQEYDQNQPFFAEMSQALKSGNKQTWFDIGHCGGKFVDYGTQVAATLIVHSLYDFIKNKLTGLFYKKDQAKLEAHRTLAQLAAEDSLVQSLAIQLKNLPRTTETDRETFRKLHEQYVSMLAQFSAHATAYMTTQTTKPATPAV